MNLKRVRGNLYEYFVTALISIGLPAIGLIYLDWRAAFSLFVIVNIALGVLAIRGKA